MNLIIIWRFFEDEMMQPYSNTDMTTAWKNSHFIVSERSNFHMNVLPFNDSPYLTYAYIDIHFGAKR